MTRRTPRILFGSALLGATIALAGAAHAEQGTIVLTTGEVLSGDIFEVVNGDHVVVKLPDGSVRAVAWMQIGTLQIGAGGQIVVHPMGGPPPPPPAPPPPPNAPPPVVYAPPPGPAYGYPPPPPEPPHRFRSRFQIGARLSSLLPGGNLVGDDTVLSNTNIPMSSYVKPGVGLEADLGLHFSPVWTFYGFWELGFLEHGDNNAAATQTPLSNFIGLGFRADFARESQVGFLLDLGAGYRWLTLPMPNAAGTFDSVTYGGPEILRLGVGMAIALDRRTHLDVMFVGSAGWFTTISSPNDPSQCASTPTGNPNLCNIANVGLHTFGGLSVGTHFDL